LTAVQGGSSPCLSPVRRAPDSLLIIGAGSAGHRHLLNAKALGVADLRVFRTGAGASRARLPEAVSVETDLAHALSRGAKAAVIANPTSLHVESALQAARAGCHLLIEKPLSHALDGIPDLLLEIRRRRLVAQVGYQFRFHPGLQHVRHWLQNDAIGVIVSAHARWGEYLPDWQPWRDYKSSYAARAELGGGVLLTLSHPIDYLRWLLGEIVRVSAVTARRSGLELDVEDAAIVQLEFESGAAGVVSLDYVQRPAEHHLTIVGRKGVIRWDNSDGVARLDAFDASQRNSDAAAPPRAFDRNRLFTSELSHFFSCIAGKTELQGEGCSIEDGEQALRICLAAKRAAEEGRRISV